jgi:hypothetical protein
VHLPSRSRLQYRDFSLAGTLSLDRRRSCSRSSLWAGRGRFGVGELYQEGDAASQLGTVALISAPRQLGVCELSASVADLLFQALLV